MAARELTEDERAFADGLTSLFTLLETLQQQAQTVVATGGDCQYAFLSTVKPEDRIQAMMYWPMFQMFLSA